MRVGMGFAIGDEGNLMMFGILCIMPRTKMIGTMAGLCKLFSTSRQLV